MTSIGESRNDGSAQSSARSLAISAFTSNWRSCRSDTACGCRRWMAAAAWRSSSAILAIAFAAATCASSALPCGWLFVASTSASSTATRLRSLRMSVSVSSPGVRRLSSSALSSRIFASRSRAAAYRRCTSASAGPPSVARGGSPTACLVRTNAATATTTANAAGTAHQFLPVLLVMSSRLRGFPIESCYVTAVPPAATSRQHRWIRSFRKSSGMVRWLISRIVKCLATDASSSLNRLKLVEK